MEPLDDSTLKRLANLDAAAKAQHFRATMSGGKERDYGFEREQAIARNGEAGLYLGVMLEEIRHHRARASAAQSARADAAEAMVAELRRGLEAAEQASMKLRAEIAKLETENGNWRDIAHREIEDRQRWRDRHIGTLFMLAFDGCISQERAREIAGMSAAEFRDFANRWIDSRHHTPAPATPGTQQEGDAMTTIERLRELLSKATPGEWDTLVHETRGSIVCSNAKEGLADIAELDWNHNRENDAALIVAAVNALPALLRCAAAASEMRIVETWRRKSNGHALEVIAEAQRRLDNALAALDKAGETSL